MSNRSAMGVDAIPATVLKRLGDLGDTYLAGMFNGILSGIRDIPQEWGMGRMTLLEKGSSTKGNLGTYRPITISIVLYRLMEKIICKRMEAWLEEQEILEKCKRI